MLLSDSRSKIWLPLLYAVITWLVNLSLSGSREEGGVNWFSCCTSSLAPLLLVRSQRPWKPSSLCVRLQKETVLVASPSDVILITLHSYLTCHSSPSFSISYLPSPFFFFFPTSTHLLCAYIFSVASQPHCLLPFDSYPAAVLSRPPPLSAVQLITSTMLSVTDSCVKWLWQHTEAWRILFQAAPESVPAPICQPKTGAQTISHSWPPVSHAGD